MPGKVAWIIGGGSGIGAAVARELALRGWHVAISGRRADKLAEVAAHIAGIHAYVIDVTEPDAAEAVLPRIVSDLGSLDLFLYGAVAAQSTRVGDYDFEKFFAQIDASLLGFVRAANPLIKQMEQQGGGQIAAFASLAGYFGLPRAAAYSASKAAMITLLETMRTELAAKNIKVRVVAPGYVKSELTARNNFPMPLLMETDEAARRIVDGLLQSDSFEIAFPRRMALAMKSIRLLPYPLFFRLMQKLMPKAR